MSHVSTWIVVLSQLSTLIFANPIYAPQFLSGGTGRNIRHLPCVSLRTGETGVCMFALTCVKANGTHLGTCIDRFYFGSCCKLETDPEIYPEDNTIEEGPSGRPFVTTDSAIESNDIPDYFTRPKPIVESQSGSSTQSPMTQTTFITTQSVQTSTESHKVITKRPIISTPYTTTQPPIGLSTFQTVHNYSQHGSNVMTTESGIKGSLSTNVRPNMSSTTVSSTVITTNEVPSRLKPSSGISSGTKRPIAAETTTKKPSSVHATRPGVTRKPATSSTRRPVSSTTERTPPATRFPPRNATTTTQPVQSSITKKPGHHSATKKPSSTTKRPVSGTRKPGTTHRPLSSVGTTGKPTTVTAKPLPTIVKVTQTVRQNVTSTQESSTTERIRPLSSSTEESSTEVRPSHRPITAKPPGISGPDRITTSRPLTSSSTSSRPRPSSKPTKPSVTSSRRPTTVKTTSRPHQVTTAKPRLPTSSGPPSSTSRPSTLRPSSVAPTRIKVTERPTKPWKSTVKPTRPLLTTVSLTSSSSESVSTTTSSILEVTSLLDNGVTLTNEILPPIFPGMTTTTTEKSTQTTHLPGFVTWSSNSDDDVTKGPEIPSTTSGISQEAITEPQWAPITTPDGWIMIQSPTTGKPVVGDPIIRPMPTKAPSTSIKPTSETTTTERVTTSRPTIPTMLSTIATITTSTDLPVSMDTLNMTDYKQVCGRRLFPESRIVGGENSTFGKWPWQISLRQWRTKAYLHKCGAALLNENWAITAAHCVENVPPSDLLLRIGEHDLANEDEPYGFQERRVQIVASHPQFDPRTFEYDLALLRFYEPLEPFQPNILPVCLPDDDENYVGHSAYVTGWGRLFEDGPLPSVLQEVSVPVINNTVCEGMYRNAGYIEHIPHIFICAGWRKGGFDSCEGDSGGPMVIRRPRDKRWILAGVISWGIGCAEPNQPGVYTRISEFREWINQILQF